MLFEEKKMNKQQYRNMKIQSLDFLSNLELIFIYLIFFESVKNFVSDFYIKLILLSDNWLQINTKNNTRKIILIQHNKKQSKI